MGFDYLEVKGSNYTVQDCSSFGNEEKEHGLTYTAFSRATTFTDVGVFDDVDFSRFTKEIPNHKKMGPRLAEERRYDRLVQETNRKMVENQYGILVEGAIADCDFDGM